jgi:hypothetical protein
LRRWSAVPAVVVVLCALVAACASSIQGNEDGRAPVRDGGPDDAAPVAPDARPARPGAEVVSTSGRVRAGARTMDVSIGHPVDQSSTRAGGRTLEGAAVINP